MICQGCNQREASVHYMEVINDKVIKLELCSVCAEERGLTPLGSSGSLILNEFVASMSSKEDQPEGASDEESSCPTCNYTFLDFRKSGRLGCPDCYLHFQSRLIPLLRDLHRGDAVRHVGRTPVSVGDRFERERALDDLRRNLDEQVRKENYEEAAKSRDMIRGLENQEETS